MTCGFVPATRMAFADTNILLSMMVEFGAMKSHAMDKDLV